MNGQPMRLAEIARLVGREPKDGSVRNAVSALTSEGLLHRAGHEYSRVQEVQCDDSEAVAPLHPEVQGANPLKGVAPLHPSATDPYTASVQGDAP